MTNRLSESASPYLRQHADNPVDWHEWGAEAFEEARLRDVPVLISIGYSACHWCHVMAHESFEDPDTAATMNSGFVNIKVDREERPDVDSVYMQATQAMTGRGGWPMTVFADHEGAPFFTGTYFPPSDRSGMPGFQTLMAAITEAWNERRSEVAEQAGHLRDALGRGLPGVEELPAEATLAAAVQQIESQYDPHRGGFGGAPKFPQQPILEFLLRIHARPWAGSASDMVQKTLAEMAAGGIRDHIGGGFSRYSVDDQWLVPHFEKMLYDNAQLARIYLWAGVEFDSPVLTEVARQTIAYLVTDLRHPEGGFYSAEDADSEGVEGKFYVWDHAEFNEVTGDDARLAGDYWGVTPEGNFEGANILYRALSVGQVEQRNGVDTEAVIEAVRRAGDALAERRAGRVRPGLDDKVVTAWNGLAIRALAEAGAALDDASYLAVARQAARFVLDRNVRPDGRLARTWTNGIVGPPAVLEDYAALAVGLFSLYAATGETEWYEPAIALVGDLSRFAAEDGGYFVSTGEDLIVRPRDHFDNPSPSGQSLAAEALMLASAYSGDTALWDRAESAVRSVATLLDRAPSGMGRMLANLAGLLDGPRELAVVGPNAASLVAPAWRRFRPFLAVAMSSTASNQPPLLEGRGRPDETLAYICRRFVCVAPVSDPAQVSAALDES